MRGVKFTFIRQYTGHKPATNSNTLHLEGREAYGRSCVVDHGVHERMGEIVGMALYKARDS